MIKLANFADLLRERASANGIDVRLDTSLVADAFRGREQSDIALPGEKLGVWYGSYPVIIASLVPLTTVSLELQTKAMHAQILIARSYVPPQHIVDMHLFLLFTGDEIDDDQAAALDSLERDEAICRKLVFVPMEPVASSFDAFADRTFLARPWAEEKPASKAFQLDEPATLVRETLEKQGLSGVSARKWISIVDSYRDGDISSQDLVNSLAAAMEAKDE